MLVKALVAAAILATTVTAQTNASYIDPNTIDGQTQAAWCVSQKHVCTVLCNSNTETNTCTSPTLQYTCLCSNGSAPGLQYYIPSMPYNICEKSADLCIAAAPNDLVAQNNCTSNIRNQCGTLQIASYTQVSTTSSASSTSSSSAPSSTSSSPATTTASAAATATTSKSAAIELVADYSFGLVGAGLVAVFGFLL